MPAIVPSVYGSTVKFSDTLTGTDPTVATEGIALKDLAAVTVIVETATPASQTLSGAGSLLAWVHDGASGGPNGWSRCPALDLSVTLSGKNRMAFQSLEVTGPRNMRLTYVPSSVTVSAGSTVTLYLLGHTGVTPANGRSVY
jgi:hypothetical protein